MRALGLLREPTNVEFIVQGFKKAQSPLISVNHPKYTSIQKPQLDFMNQEDDKETTTPTHTYIYAAGIIINDMLIRDSTVEQQLTVVALPQTLYYIFM